MTASILELDSPLGPITLRGDATALTAIELHGLDRASRPLPLPEPSAANPTAPAHAPAPAPLRAAAEQLADYFAGRRRDFELPLRPAGTAFQQAVWTALAAVPWGSTVSYGELAIAIGRPRSVRAVANAVGANPLPIVHGCHRVLAAGGRLGGYSAGDGSATKLQLLAIEGVSAPPR